MRSKWSSVFGILGWGVSTSVLFIVVTLYIGSCAGSSGGNRAPAEQGWRLAQPVSYENLTIFPVVTSQDADTSQFATLDEAIALGDAVVTEQGEYLRRRRDGSTIPYIATGGQVNQLVLVNRGKRPLLLLAGEVVSGGKQDRIIGKDRIVPPGGEPLPLDVFCVEHGRWTGGSEQFSAANTIVHPTVREKAAVDQDQSKVWAAVRGDAAAAGGLVGGVGSGANAGPPASTPMVSADALSHVIASSAPTQSYREIYQSSPVGVSVETFAQEIERRFNRATSGLKGERVVGVIVAYGGEVAWGDVFASSDLFNAYWDKLLRSYVVEAVTRPATTEKASVDDARDFLRPATGHIQEESEPGVYRWIEQSEGRESQIEIQALHPKQITLHWLKVLHES